VPNDKLPVDLYQMYAAYIQKLSDSPLMRSEQLTQCGEELRRYQMEQIYFSHARLLSGHKLDPSLGAKNLLVNHAKAQLACRTAVCNHQHVAL
jgi:hypothetical protein